MFIATQGPLEVTFANFWKMVICENIELIVMLCNLQENGKVFLNSFTKKKKKKK